MALLDFASLQKIVCSRAPSAQKSLAVTKKAIPRHTKLSVVGRPQHKKSSVVGRPQNKKSFVVGRPQQKKSSVVGCPQQKKQSAVGRPQQKNRLQYGVPSKKIVYITCAKSVRDTQTHTQTHTLFFYYNVQMLITTQYHLHRPDWWADLSLTGGVLSILLIDEQK